MDRLLNVTTVLSILMLIMVLFSVRRAHIRVEYSVSWLVASLAGVRATASDSGLRVEIEAEARAQAEACIEALTRRPWWKRLFG